MSTKRTLKESQCSDNEFMLHISFYLCKSWHQNRPEGGKTLLTTSQSDFFFFSDLVLNQKLLTWGLTDVNKSNS